MTIGKDRHNSRIESRLGCTSGALRVVLCTKKLHFSAKNVVREISSAACVSSPFKNHLLDYPKSFISRINEVCVFFNKVSLYVVYVFFNKISLSDILLKKYINFIYVLLQSLLLVIVLAWIL